MTMRKIFDSGLVNDDTEVWIYDPDLHTLACVNWRQYYTSVFLDFEVERFTWQDDGKVYIDLKYGEVNHGERIGENV